MRPSPCWAAPVMIALCACSIAAATTRDDPPPPTPAVTVPTPDTPPSQPTANPPSCPLGTPGCTPAPATSQPAPASSTTEPATSDAEPQKKVKPLPPEIAAGIALPLIHIQLPPITDEQLLERAQQALREAEFLSFDLVTTAPPSIIVRAEARMGRDRLYTRFFVRDTDEPEFRIERLAHELLVIDQDVIDVHYDRYGIDRIVNTYRSPYLGGTYHTFVRGKIGGYG